MSSLFERLFLLNKIKSKEIWDVIIIGGGATGLGIALDAANRGYKTLLLEQADFAKGTSSRSTKLVHGGVRYLANGDLRLVYEALRERGLLKQNAAHLVKTQSFVIPCYSLLFKCIYLPGLILYDILSGSYTFGKSRLLSRGQVALRFPCLETKGLIGGVEYFDAQFDDARLAVNLAQTTIEQGGVVLNYFKVTGLLKHDGQINGVAATDLESGNEYKLEAKVVVNATGVFVDNILKMDIPDRKPLVRPSQGVHIVISRTFLNSSSALMIPKTPDGRVLFAIPWHNQLLVGTTDTPVDTYALEPKALQQEISFILNTLKNYVKVPPEEKDILSVFAGLRPLAAPDSNTIKTKEISRGHKLLVSPSGLITITGGKWTTYRKMAEDTVDKIIEVGKLERKICKTGKLKIHGNSIESSGGHLSIYGSDEKNILQLIQEQPALKKKLVANHPNVEAEVIWAIRNEMARTIEDVLARRLRILFIDAYAAIEAAPRVAELMRKELNYDEGWEKSQLTEFNKVAYNYQHKTVDKTADII